MRGFIGGLVVGAVVGSGTVYAVLETPWRGDGEATAALEPDAGAEKPSKPSGKRKKRRRRSKAGETRAPIDDITVVSAAERKLVWRGPKVALPPRTMDFESGESGRSLNQGEINQGVAGARDGVIRCIGQSRKNAELTATITVKFLVSGAGRVTASRVRGPLFLHKNGLLACVRKALGRARFSGTGAPTVVTVPFDLT